MIEHPSRSALPLSLAAFAAAGLTQGSLGTALAVGPSLTGTGVALAATLGGVYGLALYARSVTRYRHAVAAVALWAGFLTVAIAHAIGLEAVAAGTPAPSATVFVLEGLTWATVLGAGTSTVFLGFREYGAGVASPEDQALDQDPDV